MRVFLQLFGTTLIIVGVVGLGAVFLSPASDQLKTSTSVRAPLPTVVVAPPTARPTPQPGLPREPVVPPVARVSPRDPVQPPPAPISPRPITWLAIPRIDLVTDVVPAQRVEDGDSLTWDIPKFVAGHAQGTAGAGQVGNAVVLGHVVSRTLGNVFEHLDKAKPGDTLRVRSDQAEFEYTIVDVTTVDRTDVEVLDPTPTATMTLITCAGIWNPVLHDYMERLVVRAELATDDQAQPRTSLLN